MLNTYGWYDDEVYTNAVATLMYHCGVSVNMHYGQLSGSGSSASASDAATALYTTFKYSPAIRYEQRANYTDNDWENMIYGQLLKQQPMLYSGRTASNTGHSFVCDGYRASDNTFHFNWGWGGYCDGYCKMTGTDALMPGGTGAGGGGEHDSYDISQAAVINIIPDANGLETPILQNAYSSALTLNDGTSDVTDAEYTHGDAKTFTLKGNVCNQSRSLTSFTLGVKATDKVTGDTYYWADTKNTNLDKYYLSDFTVSFTPDAIPYNGTYELNLVGRNVNSTSDDDWYLVTGAATPLPTITVSDATDPDKDDVTLSINESSVQVSRTLQISHDDLYDGKITYTSSNENVATVDVDGIVTGVGTGSVTITAVAAENTYFNKTTKTFSISVSPFVKETVSATISATQLGVGETSQITISDGYDGTPAYSTSDATVATVSTDGVVSGVKTGTADITVTFPETDNYSANSVTFTVDVTGDDVYFTEAPYGSNDNNLWEDDTYIHISIKNNSSTGYVWCYPSIYELTDDGEVLKYTSSDWGDYVDKGDIYTYDICTDYMYSNLTKGKTYRFRFFTDENRTQAYNIPYIDVVYRETLEHQYTLTSAGMGTLILPFDAEIPTDVDWKAYECTGVDESGTLLLAVATTTMKRNVPYVLTGSAGTVTFRGPEAIDNEPVLFGNSSLKGTMLSDTYKFQSGDYILQNQSNKVAFYKYTSGDWAATPFRAFIQTTSSDASTCYALPELNGATTAVSAVEKTSRPAGIYSIDGVKRSEMMPGLNVVVDEQGNTHKMYIKK